MCGLQAGLRVEVSTLASRGGKQREAARCKAAATAVSFSVGRLTGCCLLLLSSLLPCSHSEQYNRCAASSDYRAIQPAAQQRQATTSQSPNTETASLLTEERTSVLGQGVGMPAVADNSKGSLLLLLLSCH